MNKKRINALFVSDDDNLNPILIEDKDLDPDIHFEVINRFDVVMDFIELFKVDTVILTNIGLLPGQIPATIKNIKSANPHLPVIVLCSIDKPGFISKLAECGAETFFSVPFDLDLLCKRIKQVVIDS